MTFTFYCAKKEEKREELYKLPFLSSASFASKTNYRIGIKANAEHTRSYVDNQST